MSDSKPGRGIMSLIIPNAISTMQSSFKTITSIVGSIDKRQVNKIAAELMVSVSIEVISFGNYLESKGNEILRWRIEQSHAAISTASKRRTKREENKLPKQIFGHRIDK
jgi:hypothetical protein